MKSLAAALVCFASQLAFAEEAPAKAPEADAGISVDEMKETVTRVLAGLGELRSAVGGLDLLPKVTCGEQRSTAARRVVADLKKAWPCAQIEGETSDTEDRIRVSVPTADCRIGKRTLGGDAVIVLSGGEDRFTVRADMQRLALDTKPLATTLSYDVCGDVSGVRVETKGTMPGKSATAYDVALRVGIVPGMPIIGSTTLDLDGTIAFDGAAARDVATLDTVAYKPGELLPKTGTIRVETHTGHRLQLRFEKKFWRLGQVEVTADDRKPVTIPIVR